MGGGFLFEFELNIFLILEKSDLVFM